ncbi:hypothetical protein F120042H4_08960 [Faecalimonas umbilicata]
MQTTVVTARKIQYNRMGKIISMCNKYEENGVAKDEIISYIRFAYRKNSA